MIHSALRDRTINMMFHLRRVSVVLFLLCCMEAYCQTMEPVVQTPLGAIKGSLMKTRLDKTIYAFRGVRYGKSPDGERRFKAPEPVDSWTDVFDATKEGPSCPLPAAPEFTSEDCLRLNVYANKLPDSQNNVRRPVIVYFHPGGFYGFSAQSYVFGPEYYLDKDIVLVTVNYRLATIGFMATGDARAPGNNGLKDQVIALRWVQQNIAAFGGDPNSVTITGYSAGSWSVILHMISPMSKGLFHRAIASSGTPINLDYHLPTQQRDLVIKQARYVGCPEDSIDTAIKCLKTVPHQKLSDSISKFGEWYGNPMLIWSPVVEPEVPGVERFLTDQPINLIRAKKMHEVPLIIGLTKDEFSGGLLSHIEDAQKGNDTYFRDLDRQWSIAAPLILFDDRNDHAVRLSNELRKIYLGDKAPSLKTVDTLLKLFWDSFAYAVRLTAQLIAQNSHAPVYNYLFTYQGRYSFSTWSDTKKPFGVVHHDDLQYLFTMGWILPVLKAGDPEIPTVERMTTIWSHFAKTGEPIPKNDNKFQGVSWEPFTAKDDYLEIGKELVSKRWSPGQFEIWERLFPLPPTTCQRS